MSQRADGVGRRIGATGPWALAGLVGAGGLADPLAGLGPAIVLCVASTGLLLAIVACRLGPGHRGAVATLAVVAVAAAIAALRIVTVDSSSLATLAERGETAEVTAQVATEPRPIAHGWWAVARVVEHDGVPVRERALLRGDDEPPTLGTTWRGSVTARPLGREGFDAHVRRLHAGVELRPVVWKMIGGPGRVLGAAERVRANLRTAARTLPDPRAGIAVGIVTGDRALLPTATERAMRETGLTHLIVVSGAKVAVVVAGVLLLTRALRLGTSTRRAVLAGVVAWYVVVSRWEPSVLRAALMVAVILVAGRRGQLGDARHGLAAAVLVLVLVDPGLAGSPGLLLSAGATAGVLVIAPLLQERSGLRGRLGALVAITVGAQIGVAAPLLATFGELPVAAIPANVVAVPIVTLASVPVFAATILATLDPAIAVPLVRSAGPLLGVVSWAAEAFQGWGGHISLERPVTLLAAAATSVLLLSRRGGIPRRAAAVLTVVSVLAAAGPTLVGARSPPGLTLTAIDVGQGDAFLVESPHARILVDGGPDDTAARWLRRNGRRRLDLVVGTHAHADHVAGLPDVVARVGTGALWIPEVGADRSVAEALLLAAEAAGTSVHHPVAGETARVGDVFIEVLGPPPGEPYRWSPSELNDTSIVLRVVWRDRAVLLTGDIEEAAQRTLLHPRIARDAAVFTLPHHGAGTSLAEFLDVPGAVVAVVSAGEDNPHGHPHPDTIAALRSAGISIRRTDLEGTVTVRVPATEEVSTHLEHTAPGAARQTARRRLSSRDSTSREPDRGRGRGPDRRGGLRPGGRPLRGSRGSRAPVAAHALARAVPRAPPGEGPRPRSGLRDGRTRRSGAGPSPRRGRGGHLSRTDPAGAAERPRRGPPRR